ncbi:MAG TPA: histidine--tRNA ligase [Pseudomonadales bacterium]|nr:histidine--tRNA ligase [Pseudomonadales bacterium]
MKKMQSIRGMHDVLPGQSARWQWVEARIQDVLARFGYRQIRFPVLEYTELFSRGVGETTDVVEKEMYSFDDRGGDSVTLRPEGTAGCVRACEQHGLLYNQTQRLWYQGAMFRYERPQMGRNRQFDQIGAECFGFAGPDIDAELLVMTAEIWRALGVADAVRLEINTLGSPEARQRYRDALVEWLRPQADALDEDSRKRLERNPLRIFDSKVPSTQAIMADAPAFDGWLDDESRAHFEGLQALLDAAGVAYVVNPRIVRGLDYYTRTAFEWTTEALGAQGTVCGGGRYDGLVERLGGRSTPGIGFGMGIDRVLLLAETLGALPEDVEQEVDAYLLCLDDAHAGASLALAMQLRRDVPGLRLQMHCGGGKPKARLKRADGSGAMLALILGEQEVADGTVAVKPLRSGDAQRSLRSAELVEALQALVAARAQAA